MGCGQSSSPPVDVENKNVGSKEKKSQDTTGMDKPPVAGKQKSVAKKTEQRRAVREDDMFDFLDGSGGLDDDFDGNSSQSYSRDIRGLTASVHADISLVTYDLLHETSEGKVDRLFVLLSSNRSKGVLSKKEIVAFSHRITDLVRQHLLYNISRQNPSLRNNELDEAVIKEMNFKMPGSKIKNTLDEFKKSMENYLLKMFDMQSESSITRIDFKTKWIHIVSKKLLFKEHI